MCKSLHCMPSYIVCWNARDYDFSLVHQALLKSTQNTFNVTYIHRRQRPHPNLIFYLDPASLPMVLILSLTLILLLFSLYQQLSQVVASPCVILLICTEPSIMTWNNLKKMRGWPESDVAGILGIQDSKRNEKLLMQCTTTLL